MASSNFKYSFTIRNTHTPRKTNTQNKTKTVYPQNYTQKFELNTLQINAPFNCLKQDIIARASRVQKWAKSQRGSFVNAKDAEKFFIQLPLVLIYDRKVPNMGRRWPTSTLRSVITRIQIRWV